MRTIITDGTVPLGNADKTDQVIIVCDDRRTFSLDEVAKILDLKATMVRAPEGTEAFCLGMVAGQYRNDSENVAVLTSNENIQAAAKKFGFAISAKKSKGEEK